MIWIIVAVVLIATLVLCGVASYDRFHSQRWLVRESWLQVDVELHRRYDLIPALVQRVRAHLHLPPRLVEDLERHGAPHDREGMTVTERARRESALVAALRELFDLAERCSALRRDREFTDLQRQLVQIEDRIAAGRRFYNANVRAYNTRVESFPTSLLAARFGFTPAEPFEVADGDVRSAPVRDFDDEPVSVARQPIDHTFGR
ncbi:LemA family protein [Thermasporomyces composti]|jgi:LemA protein|uniref:LemA protein n=1 Tax=Thermasporomyces composti TaxID=696763 RepID=A0A3D9V3P3_THECX|nr:LemA family protein [Thermasporomyces composti]REF36099.1 LemA protein [Thermasporomyces composti]